MHWYIHSLVTVYMFGEMHTGMPATCNHKSSHRYAHTQDVFMNISILKLKTIYEYNGSIFILDCVRNELPETFDSMYVKNGIIHDHRTRQDDSFHILTIRTDIRKMSIGQGILVWNDLTKHIGMYCPVCTSWWRHQMKTFSALLAICAGNTPVPGEFLAQRPVTRNFDVFFDLRLNKQLSKHSWGWWFETLSRPLWRHRNVKKKNPERLHSWITENAIAFVLNVITNNCVYVLVGKMKAM